MTGSSTSEQVYVITGIIAAIVYETSEWVAIEGNLHW